MVRSRSAQRPTGGWRILSTLTRRYRRRMGLLALSSFAGAILEAGFLVLVTTTVLALAADQESIGPYLGHTIPIGTALAIAAFAVATRLGLNLVTVRISAGLAASVRTDQRQRLSHAYLRASWGVQHGEAAGRLQELLTSFVWRVNNAVTALTTGVTAALSLAAFLATGISVDAASTLAVLGVLALLGAVMAPVRRAIRRRAAQSAANDLAFANAVSELGSLGQEMQTFGVQTQFVNRIDDLIRSTSQSLRRVQWLQGSLTPLYTTFAYTALLMGIGVLMVVGVGDLSAVGSVTLLMLRSLSYGQQLLAVSGTIASSLPSLERLEATMDTYEANTASQGAVTPAGVTPLDMQSVSFAYTAQRPALTALSARIDHGEVIGIIGPSGAGKSTLAQLLLGLRDPSQGHILVSGVDLTTVDRQWWTRRVAFVPQDALLLTGTVAENIRFVRDDIGEAALREAAAQANVLADITALPEGFDTHLGERGSQLSGGQRQRLSIARALAGRPELLVLDEPTSALDGESESLIRDTIAGLQGRITVVIIAHRMSTLDMCDRIMVIEDGRMTALDTPDALREKSEFYRRALVVAGIA
jgi:ATP-binding cassette, subfamily B, bacterial